jgi:hypothetical protein
MVTVVIARYSGSKDLKVSQWWPWRLPFSDAMQAFCWTHHA